MFAGWMGGVCGRNDGGAVLRIKAAASSGPSHGRLCIIYGSFALGFCIARSPWPYIETGTTLDRVVFIASFVVGSHSVAHFLLTV